MIDKKRDKLTKEPFYKADLHIHTPKSDCFNGEDNKETYLKILEKVKKENINVLAITDHNSIKGYIKILNIKKELLSRRNDESLSKKERDDIKKKLLLFKDLLILPGIEFETLDCLHILIIFNNKMSIKDIENFLVKGGYKKEQYGIERPSILSIWNVLNLYDELRKYECIVIDAHTDSNKGLYSLPKNMYRANCFKSDRLNAIAYKDEIQKDKLKSIINNNIEYKRNNDIAFIKASDAHSINAIGSEIIWVKLDKLDFNCLKNAFKNPIENISIEYPAIKNILEKLINSENSFFVKDFEIENIYRSKQIICALNNTVDGHILFGITELKNKQGIRIETGEKEELKDLAGKIFSMFNDIDGRIVYNINFYPINSKKIIIALKIVHTENLASIKNEGKIYFIKDKKVYTAIALEVQKKVEERQLLSLQNNLIEKIEKVEKECFLIKNTFYSIPIIKKFENNSVYLSNATNKLKIIEPTKFNKIITNKIRELKCMNQDNGQSFGNIIFINETIPPRLNYAYLRITPPTIEIREIKTKENEDDAIYFVPDGATFFGSNNLLLFCEKDIFIAKILKYKNYPSLRFICAFLKSSFFIWYCKNKFPHKSIFELALDNNIIIPRLRYEDELIKQKIDNLEKTFNEIISKEKFFLDNKLEKNLDEIDTFNKELENNFSTLDETIYSLIGLDKSEIDIIKDCLKTNNVFLGR